MAFASVEMDCGQGVWQFKMCFEGIFNIYSVYTKCMSKLGSIWMHKELDDKKHIFDL